MVRPWSNVWCYGIATCSNRMRAYARTRPVGCCWLQTTCSFMHLHSRNLFGFSHEWQADYWNRKDLSYHTMKYFNMSQYQGNARAISLSDNHWNGESLYTVELHMQQTSLLEGTSASLGRWGQNNFEIPCNAASHSTHTVYWLLHEGRCDITIVCFCILLARITLPWAYVRAARKSWISAPLALGTQKETRCLQTSAINAVCHSWLLLQLLIHEFILQT